jgi:hypothetical protein
MPKRRKRSPVDVWVLTITRDIDDYKRRGESPSSSTSIHVSKKKAIKVLSDYMRKHVKEIEDDEDSEGDEGGSEGDKDDEDRDSEGEPQTLTLVEIEDSNSESSDKGDKEKHKDEPRTLTLDEIEDYHEKYCKGEFITYVWTYDLDRHTLEYDTDDSNSESGDESEKVSNSKGGDVGGAAA